MNHLTLLVHILDIRAVHEPILFAVETLLHEIN